MFLKVAVKSLLSRKGSAVMTLMAISVAIFVLLGIEQIRQQARDSFASTVSGVDLINAGYGACEAIASLLADLLDSE